MRWYDHSAFKCGVCGDVVHTRWTTSRWDKINQYCDYCIAKTLALNDDTVLDKFTLYNGSGMPNKTFLYAVPFSLF
jgi:hypothetical protein